MRRPLNSIDILVGKALMRLRKDRSRTVDEMADALTIDGGLLLEIEAGQARAPAQLLMRASVRFGVPVSSFYE